MRGSFQLFEGCNDSIEPHGGRGLGGRNVGRNRRQIGEWIDQIVGEWGPLLLHERESILAAKSLRRRPATRGHRLHAGNLKSAALECTHERRAHQSLAYTGIRAGDEDAAALNPTHVRAEGSET